MFGQKLKPWLIAVLLGTVLQGCSLVSVSLPPSLFGIKDPNQPNQQYSGSPSESRGFFANLGPKKDPALLNRRRPALNPGAPVRGAAPEFSMTQGGASMMPPSMQMPPEMRGAPPPMGMPDAMPMGSAGLMPRGMAMPAPSMPAGMGGYSTPSLPSMPADVNLNRGADVVGWGRNSQGDFNPFMKYKMEPVFEPLTSIHTMTSSEYKQVAWLDRGFIPLVDVPEEPEALKRAKEEMEPFELLEAERDAATMKNQEIRSPEGEEVMIPSDEKQIDDTLVQEVTTSNKKVGESTGFLRYMQELITIRVPENGYVSPKGSLRLLKEPSYKSVPPVATVTTESNVQKQNPPEQPVPQVEPYQPKEKVIVVHPSRYKLRRSQMY
jgi:hypothetical protein